MGISNSVPSEGWAQLPSAINTALGVDSFIIFNNEVYGFGGDFNEVASEYRHWGVKYNGTAWTDITNTIMAIRPTTVLYGEVLGNEIYLFDSGYTVYKYRNGHLIQVNTTNSGGYYGGIIIYLAYLGENKYHTQGIGATHMQFGILIRMIT